jgi:hypothetical protein
MKYTFIVVECVWNVMAHTQKPDFVFWGNGRVHLNRRGHQFSRLLAVEVCASAVVMLDTPCSEVVWRVLATQFTSLPFTSLPVRHRVPSHFNWTLQATQVTMVKSVCEYKEYGFIIKKFNQVLISTSICHSAHCKHINKQTNKQKTWWNKHC